MVLLSLLLTALLAADPAVPTTVGPAGGKLDALLSRRTLSGVSVSIAVLDVETGRLIHARDADRPMVPASNMKLMTTAAALALLGPDHRFRTRFLATEGPDAEGRVAGDLIVVGAGDPTLRGDVLETVGIDAPAAHMADMLVEAGLRAVDGDLVVDDGIFDDAPLHADWPDEDIGRDYASPICGLSLEANCLTLTFDGRGGSPSVRIEDRTKGYTVQSELTRSRDRSRFSVWATRPDEHGVLVVRGEVGAAVVERELRVPVREGAMLFGRSLRAELERRGVALKGQVVRRPGAAASLSEAAEVAVLTTPLSTAVLLANKESDNSIADHLYKLIGDQHGGAGSFAGGSAALNHFLTEWVGTDTGGLVLRDGSGLSSRNRLTARAVAETLAAMARAEHHTADLFLRTLPVAGMDGSLHERLTEAAYRGTVRAKTGWISGASSLSGYVHTRSGRTLAFSLLFNRVPGGKNHVMKSTQDDICRYLVDAL